LLAYDVGGLITHIDDRVVFIDSAENLKSTQLPLSTFRGEYRRCSDIPMN
jgi:hypothetical protein